MYKKLFRLLLGKNSSVLSFFFNDSIDWSTFLIADGNEFHRAGAAEEINARSPNDLNLGVHGNVPLKSLLRL